MNGVWSLKKQCSLLSEGGVKLRKDSALVKMSENDRNNNNKKGEQA